VSEWNWSSGPMKRPLGEEMQDEHQAELREELDRSHKADQAARPKRPWWKFWARRPS
jgi:hypothetical protein